MCNQCKNVDMVLPGKRCHHTEIYSYIHVFLISTSRTNHTTLHKYHVIRQTYFAYANTSDISTGIYLSIYLYRQYGISLPKVTWHPGTDMESIPIHQFQNLYSNSVCSQLFFGLIFFTMSRYSEYLLGIHTPSSLYSK